MSNYNKLRLSGWIGVIVGCILELFSILTIQADKTPQGFLYYTYKPPLTSHETAMIFLAVFSAVLIIAGIVLIVRANKYR
ncbi:MAG: hypothetical protein IJF88_03165 [Oscillospiraceae bacterium]|nr:hypothetical protein [Oscillospiraceae bacterium]MBQ2633563.1 hypothetical protein [Oscillospiraceae bacterium]MBR3083888.1 hypothetical protein [Oscillospiraceae bacterium]